MSELTQHGRKALERCIREHQNFIRLADDYDLDEMSVQALRTGIESMQMRLDAAPNPAPGPSEHDESWAEMMEHDYDTAVRGPVISNPEGAAAYCRELSELHSRVLTEADNMLALAIKAAKATHAQPVTPAGGEVVAYRYVADEGVYNPFVRDWLDGSPDRLDLENIARHPGVRFEFAYSNPPVPDHELQQKWFRRGRDMYVELHGETHPPVADAALPRGHSISDAKQALGVDESLNIEALRGLLRTYENCPATGQREATALRAAIAALGQPGSPLVERVHIASPNDLDPITAYLEDHGGGKGRLTIACYGDAWTGYWGAMGSGLREFVAGTDPDYVAGNLLGLRRNTLRERHYVASICAQLIAALNQRGGG